MDRWATKKSWPHKWMINTKLKGVATTKPICIVHLEISVTSLMVMRSWENQMIQSIRSNTRKLINCSNISIAAVIIQDKNQNQEEVWWTTVECVVDTFIEEVEVATWATTITAEVITTVAEVATIDNKEVLIKDQETTRPWNANSLNKVSTNLMWF